MQFVFGLISFCTDVGDEHITGHNKEKRVAPDVQVQPLAFVFD